MSIESISQQSSSFEPVVLSMKFTGMSSSMPSPAMRRAVKYPFILSSENSALSMIASEWRKNARFSSELHRKARYWDGVSPSSSICSARGECGLEYPKRTWTP